MRLGWLRGALLLGALAGAGCDSRRPAAEVSVPTMGTTATLTLAPPDAGRLRLAAGAVRHTMVELEAAFSVYDPGSEISRLNAAAGRQSVAVSERVGDILRQAKHYGAISGGAFDVTVSPLVALWGFRAPTAPAEEPAPERIRDAMGRVGCRWLVLDEGSAYLTREGMSVDLGGIGKGYAVDAACVELANAGVRHAMVNLGGNIRCLGRAAGDRPWKVGVRNPFDRREIVGVLAFDAGQSVATSGNYERFLTIRGRRYGHILDPRTGYPVVGMAGVTVVAGSATEADAFSTALFVLGPEEGLRMLRTETNAVQGVLWIPDEQPPRLLATEGFMRRFSPLPAFAPAVSVLGP